VKRIAFFIAGLAGLAVVMAVAGCRAARPELGAAGGNLAPCPDSPNCVNSQSEAASARIAPFPFTGPSSAALARLKTVVLSQPRMKLVAESPGYLRFESTTAVFRFVDDLEFLADDKGGVIHVRSASRIGHSDLGLNRRRVEKIRALFEAAKS
jgi:uncharacterized protein (DUF1499 family)